MLSSLTVKNYALIQSLNVDIFSGMSVITGETGAGKSILLGALGLVLGKRADLSVVYDKNQKCVVEACFNVKDYDLIEFFEKHDLDFEEITTIRREILPSGKSRAFVNDTPTNLSVLTELSQKLIDIHSQHETLQLADQQFQFEIIDAIGVNKFLLNQYQEIYKERRILKKELRSLEEQIEKERENQAYNQFILDELQAANLKVGEIEMLEDVLHKLSHAEEIQNNLVSAVDLADDEQIGLNSNLILFKSFVDKIAKYDRNFQIIFERLQSNIIDFQDIVDELRNEMDRVEADPDQLQRTNDRLQLLYDLLKKHRASDIEELLIIEKDFERKVNLTEQATDLIKIKENKIKQVEEELTILASQISDNRKEAADLFTKRLHEKLSFLEMKNTRLNIVFSKATILLSNGFDEMNFYISSDAGKTFDLVKKIASGGEMSRIMLAVKNILSQLSQLPTIIFDEIDTGVSGEVSKKVAYVMKEMGRYMQVLAITHLPQIAANGSHHYKVFKDVSEGSVTSNIKELREEERIKELAEMLGGKELTASALAHAKELLSV
ncbi:DNA repair protein RecN [Namhaeicola litoreus]|uniref:DNA repair protein RecN n=1 Tax=Namhaeicola litoreus TaxID=1052145 RepID=A0ABW3Y3P7_9FLAO